MSDQPVIAAHALSKSYRIWTDPAARLLGPIWAEAAGWLPGTAGAALQRRAHAAYRDFFALQDVSFEVRRGEAVGIVGRNGAGKSTLLQLIAGTLQPTSGSIEVRGRVAALLELGAGFNPEFTGRENVFLSGAVLGLSKAEMEARFDAVAAFADIGDFIEQPVKTYSSGMMMRLAFAVNTCVDPEILIVDEALSVGDAPFQAKCFRRLRQLIDQGVSLLFVSHDLGTVRSICSRALWLKQGRAEQWGAAKEVALSYEKYCWKEQGVVLDDVHTGTGQAPLPAATAAADTPPATGKPAGDFPPALLEPAPAFIAARDRSSYGTGDVVISNLVLTDGAGNITRVFEYGEEAVIHLLIEARQPVASEFMATFLLRDLKGNAVLAAQDVSRRQRIDASAGSRSVITIRIPLPLHHQSYLLHAAVFGFKDGQALPGGRYDFANAVLWEVIDEAAIIEVRPCKLMPLSGPVHFDLPVKVQQL